MFVPVYLYIKQHSITGKLYFGKTCNPDPIKYEGSGKHWSPHVKVHGKEHVETLWYCLFTEKDELVKFALGCSELWDIVKSEDWLNFKPENGLDGAVYGSKLSEETKMKIAATERGKVISNELRIKLSMATKGRKLEKRSFEHCNNLSKAARGKSPSIETRIKLSNSTKGIPRSLEVRKKISNALKGKPQGIRSKESIEKQAAKLRGRKQSVETIAKRIGNKRGPYRKKSPLQELIIGV